MYRMLPPVELFYSFRTLLPSDKYLCPRAIQPLFVVFCVLFCRSANLAADIGGFLTWMFSTGFSIDMGCRLLMVCVFVRFPVHSSGYHMSVFKQSS